MSYAYRQCVGIGYICEPMVSYVFVYVTYFHQVPDDANEDNYYFDVELTLPLPQEAPLLTGLATYLPSFNQTFEQLDSYNLDSFIVQGSLGSINIEVSRSIYCAAYIQLFTHDTTLPFSLCMLNRYS